MNRVVAGLLVLALVLGAGAVGASFLLGGDDSSSSSSSGESGGTTREPERPVRSGDEPDEGATEAPSPDLQPYYSQTLEWSECGEFECGWLEAPLDYEDPDGKTIDLALLKVPAEAPDQRVGSLVVNPGGPGAPGTEYAAQAALAFRPPLLDHFDVVGFDPRGTGRSNPIDCVSDAEVDELRASDPDPDGAAELAESEEDSARFFEGCREKSGDLVDHVSTVEAAKDMDILRAALGQDELDYLGASYGTQLGATYAELFPDRVGFMVLDGAVDVSLDERQASLDQARGFETALRAYVQNCVDGGDCYLGDSLDEGLASIKEFLDEVDQKPIPAGDRELRAGDAFYALAAPLYNREYWRLLDQALKSGMEGDGRQLMMLADLYSSRGPDGYTDNSSEAIRVINCLDDPTSIPVEEVPAEFEAFEKASPTLGRIFAWALTGCEDFDGRTTEPLEIDGAGAPPILVTGTTRDPATPYKWAEALADQLESGVLLTRDGDGHTAYNRGNECVDETIESFLVDGKVPDGDVTC
ncbi:alpha/beta hydrolase [Nocardioides campestrisoli]|uniref:alpha/beta hydrolase n=1 Tax=Nocardioides campestrisoli TaxID=2736757 RepID=UPI00163DAFE1|nr:alpha/beta hydrolase [Nocardioides campestrisoli]